MQQMRIVALLVLRLRLRLATSDSEMGVVRAHAALRCGRI
jgi:hypothetical protein